MPSVTLSTYVMALLARLTRSNMLDVLREQYVRTARAKGLRETIIVHKHALMSAALPIVTVLGLQVGALLSGAVVTETVFNWPGIGTLALRAIQQRDYPVVQGVVLVSAALFVLINGMVDLAYRYLDPRVRLTLSRHGPGESGNRDRGRGSVRPVGTEDDAPVRLPPLRVPLRPGHRVGRPAGRPLSARGGDPGSARPGHRQPARAPGVDVRGKPAVAAGNRITSAGTS